MDLKWESPRNILFSSHESAASEGQEKRMEKSKARKDGEENREKKKR
jgi:hypothetical protein